MIFRNIYNQIKYAMDKSCLQTDRKIGGQGDSYITPPPPTSFTGVS